MPEPVRRAFVLAAGLGTRLRPLTEELPKPAWPFFDVPLAAHVLRALAAAGVEEVVVNLHHLGDPLRRALEPWIPAGLAVRWSPEPDILGTGGALVPWRERLGQGPFLLCNADTYQELDLADLTAFHRRKGGAATLVLRPAPPGSAAPIERDSEGRIVRFLDARAPGAPEGAPCEFTGVHLIEPPVLAHLPAGRFCINADVHRRLVARGEPLFGYVAEGEPFWSDLGTPERYLAAHRAFLGAGRLPEGSPGRLVLADEETGAGGRLAAPCYLGPGAEVGRGSRAGPFAVLGAGVRLAEGASAARCVLWEGVRLAGGGVSDAIVSPSGCRLSVPQPG